MSKRQEQWMEVGKAFETELPRRTERQQDLACSGLCHAWRQSDERRNYGSIPRNYCFNPLRVFGPTYEHWVPIYLRENRLIRATFAYLMAAMTDAERDAIMEGL